MVSAAGSDPSLRSRWGLGSTLAPDHEQEYVRAERRGVSVEKAAYSSLDLFRNVECRINCWVSILLGSSIVARSCMAWRMDGDLPVPIDRRYKRLDNTDRTVYLPTSIILYEKVRAEVMQL